jgi:hypothetical protein
MKKIYSLFFVMLLCIAKSQNPTFAWAKSMGDFTQDQSWSIATDASGNVYTTGYFQGTVDFDPGAGVFNLTSAGQDDIFIQKLDAGGNFIWAKRMGATSVDVGFGLTTDGLGNIYTTGYFQGTVDFDPGAGVFNLISGGSYDIFIQKLDASGNFIWAKSMGGVTMDQGWSITIDVSGNVCTTGYFSGTVDFDPGAAVFNLVSASTDIFIQKLDAAGNFIWAKRIGAASTVHYSQSISTDASGNIFTAGYFQGTVDFDPGAGVFNLTTVGSNDIFIQKLDANGNFIWAKSMGTPSDDRGFSLRTDASGNVFTTGYFGGGTIDFDPGPGVFNLTSAGTNEIFVQKLDAGGNFVWAKSTGGSTSSDIGYALTTDGAGAVYTTGQFEGTVDFDPGPGVFNLAAGGFSNVFIQKLDAGGNFVWAKSMGGPSYDVGFSIATDGSGNVYTTGHFYGTADYDPDAAVFNLTSAGSDDIFIQKLNQCIVPAQAGAINGATNVCTGVGSTVYSVSAVFAATSYTWNLPAGWSGISSTNSISATPGSSGIFTITASSACGTSPQQTLNVTVNPLPTITVNSGSICSGQSFTLMPNGASTYTIQGGNAVVSPVTNISYTVIGTSSAGCAGSNTATSSVIVNPSPTISVNSGGICSGQSFTIIPNGASAYTIQGANTVVSPTTNTSYTVIGASSVGCISSNVVTSNVIVNAQPTVSVNSGAICVGQSFTIVPSGASAYTIQGGNTVVNPTTSATYSVTGTSTAGCISSNTAVSNVIVNPLPIIAASSSTSQLCIGSSATLTGSGGTTYTWTPGGTGSSIVISPTVNTSYTINGTDANGCSNTSTITQAVINCGASGIVNLSVGKESFKVYPNPFNNKIRITSFAGSSFQIFNTLGTLICTGKIENGEAEIDLSNQSSGIYFVKINTTIRKVIKE